MYAVFMPDYCNMLICSVTMFRKSLAPNNAHEIFHIIETAIYTKHNFIFKIGT